MTSSMSSKFLVAAALAACALGVATAAHARTDVHLSIGVPGPVYAQPAPVYVPPQPVYVQPAPVYAAPPVVYGPQPVYVVPRGYGWRDRDEWRRAEWRREEWRRRHWHEEHERRWRD